MKQYQFWIYLLVSVCAVSAAKANPVPLSSAEVISVKGNVTYSNLSTTEAPLTTETVLTEGDKITTGNVSSVHLIFSNGSELIIEANSSLFLLKLEQEPFESNHPYVYPNADPSKSNFLLKLRYGAISGHVKGLRKDSTFVIETLLGTVSIAGTRFTLEQFHSPQREEFIVNVLNKDGAAYLISKVQGTPVYGPKNVAILLSDPNLEEAKRLSIPPTRTFSIRQSSQNPRFQGFEEIFPRTFRSRIVPESETIEPYPSDQNVIVVSPNS